MLRWMTRQRENARNFFGLLSQGYCERKILKRRHLMFYMYCYGLNVVVTPVGCQPGKFPPLFANLGNFKPYGERRNYIKLYQILNEKAEFWGIFKHRYPLNALFLPSAHDRNERKNGETLVDLGNFKILNSKNNWYQLKQPHIVFD